MNKKRMNYIFIIVEIILSFIFRSKKSASEVENYEEWLQIQMGNYFAKKYPMKYTKKYWCIEAKELETKWIGNRIYSPSFWEIFVGAFWPIKKNFYYGKNMRYPQKGGFWSFFEPFTKDLNIKLNKEVSNIDIIDKRIIFMDGTEECYDKLISSIPLTEYSKLITNIPLNVDEACKDLLYTSGYIVSLGIKGNLNLKNCLWFYVYDEDKPFARVYVCSKKSPQNAPNGYTAIQAEIYFLNEYKRNFDMSILKNKTIDSLIKMDLFKKNQILVSDIRYEKYANVVFKKDIYKKREIILDFLNKSNIIPIGRFGKWEYFWSDQTWLDSKKIAQLLNKKEHI